MSFAGLRLTFIVTVSQHYAYNYDCTIVVPDAVRSWLHTMLGRF